MSMGFKSPSMAVARKAAILLGLALLSCVANGASRGHLFNAGARRSLTAAPERKVFDVTAFGAKTEEQQKGGGGGGKGKPSGGGSGIPDLPSLPGGDDEKMDSADEAGPGESPNEDNSMAFIRTWIAACRGGYTGPTKVVIPKGNFLIGPVVFQGPCNSSKEPIVVEVQGLVKASTDLSEYTSPEWVTFEMVDGLIVTGDGTFDGQGQVTWKNDGCGGKGSCSSAESPSSLKFNKVKNALVEKITSVNPKFFHTHLYGCNNVTLDNVHLVAPAESPNTDGVHISTSEHIKVINSVIATGDDCVSMGQGSRDILVNNITCGPGHGISVGSLGKYDDEAGVSQIVVTNCTLKNTTNGARIKTWAGKSAGEATGIIYENIVMDQVQSPIVIDQNYGKKKGKAGKEPSGPPSKWKISDVHFRNIRGTSSRNVAVNLACSSANPCVGVEFTDIDLAYQGTSNKDTSLTTQCFNAKIAPKGVQNPQLCH